MQNLWYEHKGRLYAKKKDAPYDKGNMAARPRGAVDFLKKRKDEAES